MEDKEREERNTGTKGKLFFAVDATPLSKTALIQQFQLSALGRWETTHLKPSMTGLVKTEECPGFNRQLLDQLRSGELVELEGC